MYSADPFAASKEVAERQAKAAKKIAAAEDQTSTAPNRSGSASGQFMLQTEVKMSIELRERVEKAVKKARAHSPISQIRLLIP